MMEKINVSLKKRIDESYPIFIDEGLLQEIPSLLKKEGLAAKYAIITDSNVEKLYGQTFLKNLRETGLPAEIFVFPAGEKNKSRKTKEALEDGLAKAGFGRDSLLIALGGGVVGDMVGFVAATYMRGIPYVQVPTTLLASDSAIGGKTGVDTSFGKNLIGAFHQPKGVYFDTELLATLPLDELKSGIAETIKHAMIADKDFFSYLEENMKAIMQRDKKCLTYILKKNCQIKAKIVEADEKERGQRKILNYGHTFGHGIEAASEYTISHGFAVAIGMCLAAKLAQDLRMLTARDFLRQQKLIESASLPTQLPKNIRPEKVLAAMQNDKKKKDGKLQFILAKGIGQAVVVDDILPVSIIGVLR